MQAYITPERIANSIRQQRSQYKGAFLIVEGEGDNLLYRNFIDRNGCQIQVAFGKENVLNVFDILGHDHQGVLAIVDADFWRLENIAPANPQIFITDTHDLETMLLQSPALDKFLGEYGSHAKIKAFEKQHGNLRDVLLENGANLGYLLWYSLKNDLALKFDDKLSFFSKFITKDTLTIDIKKMLTTVKNHAQKFALSEQVMEKGMNNLKSPDHDLWQVCCGHHLMAILAIGLQKAIGSDDLKEVKPEIVEKNLRLAYEFIHFMKTQLYQAIKNWEFANPTFKVLLATT